ncbi:hypothetical protein J4210_03680 [Candidatus Woesearchaeota archaeon]|nr:hypothetical protein [Candidatus Woesearchaeota archaeon]
MGMREEAQERIAKDLGFTAEQLLFMGKIISLPTKTTAISKVEVVYTNVNDEVGPVLELYQPRSLSLSVVLYGGLSEENHDTLQEKIGTALERVGIKRQSLFSYCTRSYGIDREDLSIDVHFGFYD